MAYLDGHSKYKTNCSYFRWKFVNYDKTVQYESFYSGGNRLYAPECLLPETQEMFYRPLSEPCDGCPYYAEGEEQGLIPPGGYNV